jgi:hypothetical protein
LEVGREDRKEEGEAEYEDADVLGLATDPYDDISIPNANQDKW